MTGTHLAFQKSQHMLKVITKASLEALRTFRFVSWYLKSKIQLPFLGGIWKSCATDFGTQFAHFLICGYCNSLLKLCPSCTLLLVSCSLVVHVSMVMGADLGHGAWTSRAWWDSQEFMPSHHSASDSTALQWQPDFPCLSLLGKCRIDRDFSHKSSYTRQVTNCNCLHLENGSNIRIRSIILHYSMIWTGSWMFWLEVAHWRSLKLLLSSFLHRSFPLCFQERMKTSWKCYSFLFHIYCANGFWTRLTFPLQKLSF